MTGETDPDEWGRRYRTNRGTYESMALRFKALLADLLGDAKIDVIQVEARAKDVDSFVEKIGRKGEKYKNPLTEVTDLVGLRIITYYQEDVARVGEILSSEFKIDTQNSVDKNSLLAPDRFGYASVHHIVTLSDGRKGLAEWKAYAKIPVEIQVRTALQHAWAAVNHKLDYKSETEVPDELRRRLFRLNALFELADEQFSKLRDDREKLNAEYKSDVRDGLLDIGLNEASLGAYLNSSDHADAVRRRFGDLGFTMTGEDERRLKRDRLDLLKTLASFDINTVAELDRYLVEIDLEKIPEEFGTLDAPHINFEDILTQFVMLDKNINMNDYLEIYTDSGWDKFTRVAEIYQRPGKKS